MTLTEGDTTAAAYPDAPGQAVAGASASLVRLEGVGKRFPNGTVALEGVDLAIEKGEFVSLLGPSGCGKSTILRLVSGLDTPTAGRLVWNEAAIGKGRRRQVPDGASRLPEVGFVFQEATLMPWAKVFDNVFLPLRLAGVSRRAAHDTVMEALDSVELADFAEAYPRELSGGMKMRVSIARALATDPTVLLMDEPFAALDEITRFRLNNDLLRLWETRGWTVVFVTHSVFESVYLATRIVVMAPRPGRIVSELSIDVPAPRDEAFRTSARYADLCRTTSAALEKAMRP